MPASKTQQQDVSRRREQVVARRAIGIPTAVIARELGITEETVRQDVHHELKDRRAALDRDRDLLVVLEAEELEAVRRTAWEVINRDHFHVSASGRVSMHPDTDEPLRDDGPILQGLGVVLRAQQRRSELLGLNSAQKLEMRAEVVTLDAIDAAIADLRRQLGEFPTSDRGDVPGPA